MPLSGAPVRVFLSYAWEDDTYRELVKSFAVRLREDGIDARLDAWHLDGLTIPEFMSRETRLADHIFVLCSPAYQRKVHAMEEGQKTSGSGWEHMLLTSALWTGAKDRSAIIPVLFKGHWNEAAPSFLSALPYRRLNDELIFEAEYRALLQQLANRTEKPPPVGDLPDDLGTKPAPAMRGKTVHRTFTSKLPTVDPLLIGREKELAFLDQAWANPNTNVVQIIASGGTGKTALMDKWFRQHLGEATIFGWSFYSQGTSQDRQTSSDPFFAEALRFFAVNVDPGASAYAKAEALAEKFRHDKVLLLLDGVEPLQDSSGDMKDQALKALLQELDTHNAGLVLCTTRVRLTDIPDDGDRALSWDLDNLSPEASLAYIRKLGVKGEDDELKQASKDYGHHALALTLLGHYLVDFCEGDVRREVEIPKLMVDEVKQGRHARRVMAAYEETFAGKPELDILKGLGYFDRPAEPAALQLVLPDMPSLKDKAALKRLRELRLVLDDDGSTDLDCHPLIREHFAQYATQEGHARLYEHYQKQAPEKPDTLAEMTPLFYAIYHGCQAGRHPEARVKVYRDRVRRGNEVYLTQKLGFFGTDLALLTNFFANPWSQPIATLSPTDQAWVINEAAFALRALGRLADAVDPMHASAEASAQLKAWDRAAVSYSNLSDILLTLGSVRAAISAAQKSVDFATRSGDSYHRVSKRTTLAYALHQSGDPIAARTHFTAAERLQVVWQPNCPILYSLWGYRYCDLLLAQGQNAEVHRRATQSLVWMEQDCFLVDIALDHLSLARAGDPSHFAPAIDGLRRAGYLDYLCLGLLARGTQHDLDEVYKIATRSGMRLHLTDYHLKQAALDLANGNQTKAREHTQKAADLIQATGYHRRDPDLARLRQQL